MHFPIHHMSLVQVYGPVSKWPKDGDVTYSFSCRQAVPSPCSGGTGTGSWSMHAYGEAIDVNTKENPYVQSGVISHANARTFRDRTRVRPGMAVEGGVLVRAFARIGWGWGGRWSGSQDYQHFSITGS
jgi:hypothetical protein